MALGDGLRTVIEENRAKGYERLREAILSWAKKKKISTVEFRKLRTTFIDDLWPVSAAEEESMLKKGATVADIATSLARLAADGQWIEESEHQGEVSNDQWISKQWLSEELKRVQVSQTSALTSALERLEKMFSARLDDLNGKICLRLQEAEAQIDSLKLECSQQAEEINSLKARVQVLEDSQETEDRRKRSLNLIIQGVEAQSKEGAFDNIKDLFSTTLDVPVRPVEVVRIRSASSDDPQPKMKFLVRLENSNDKIAVLRKCFKLKDKPHIRIWEDLTPHQQARKKALMPKFKEIRNNGKIAYFRGDKLFMKESPATAPVQIQLS